jgi:TetR/AcrR family transcriptional regulator
MVRNVARDAAPQDFAGAFDRRAQFAAKRRALLQEAGMVFGQRGFGNTSLDDIAQNLNITKAALYYYFKSKHEILYECYAASFDLADNALARAIAEGENPRAQLRMFVANYTLGGLKELHQTMALRDLDVLTPEYREIIDLRRTDLHRRLRVLIDTGIADGSFVKCDSRVLVMTLVGAISWVFRAFNGKGELSAEQVTEQIVGLLAGGFESRSNSD